MVVDQKTWATIDLIGLSAERLHTQRACTDLIFVCEPWELQGLSLQLEHSSTGVYAEQGEIACRIARPERSSSRQGSPGTSRTTCRLAQTGAPFVHLHLL